MAEAARQVTTLAVLGSQHAVVTHRAVVALQQEEQERRQQQLKTAILNLMTNTEISCIFLLNAQKLPTKIYSQNVNCFLFYISGIWMNYGKK